MAAGCAAAAGGLWAAVFPPLEWTWAAWGALAPLWVMARRAASDRQALRLGGAAGFLHWLLAIRWLTHVTVGGWIVLAAWCALFVLPPVWLARRWRGGGLGFAAALAVVWCGCEFVRGRFGWGGFPWAAGRMGLTPWLPAIRLAEFGGVWLVSGLAVLPAACWRGRWRSGGGGGGWPRGRWRWRRCWAGGVAGGFSRRCRPRGAGGLRARDSRGAGADGNPAG